MRLLVLVLAGAALLLSVALSQTGFNPVVPTAFVAALAAWLPLGWVLSGLISVADTHTPNNFLPLVGVAVATALLQLYSLPFTGLVSAILFFAVLARPQRPSVSLLWAVGAVVFGYTALWSANYLALNAVHGRMADHVMKTVDAWFYRQMWPGVGYSGLFPLTDNSWILRLLDAAYVSFFAELAVLLFVLEPHADRLTEYLIRLFVCYGVALLVFVVWPVAGPYLMYPESTRSTWLESSTGALMAGGLREFSAIRNGVAPPTTTLGYFVGMPSMHAAGAVLFQTSLRPTRLTWWVFLPVNVLMVVSTVVLGLHYIADTVIGLVLGLVAVRTIRLDSPKQGERVSERQ